MSGDGSDIEGNPPNEHHPFTSQQYVLIHQDGLNHNDRSNTGTPLLFNAKTTTSGSLMLTD
ncbi:MAG: hypothetical protein CL862_02410 [Cyanobium sp. NAT70]|nr:hypothetical protein [Cyanobium sp. NAT70]MAR08768.1 hypothetical protein [Blastopirellula sp.]